MSTLRELRETLAEQADALDDAHRYARPVAVRQRIRVVRRRRAAAASVAAALVLVAGAALVVALPGRGSLEPASVAGVDVPRTIAVLDFPYELADTMEVGSGDRVEVGEQQAVTLVGTGLGDGSATLLRDGDPVARVLAGEPVAAPLPVEGVEELEVRLDGTPGDARVGVATYEGTGQLAPGVSNGATVFRETYAGQPLLGAAFADDGASSVDFTAQSASVMRFVGYCVTPEPDLFLTVEVDGESGFAIGCGDTARRDATTGSSAVLDRLGAGPHDVHVFLTRDGDGPEVEADEVTLGVGVYAEQRGPRVPGYGRVASRVESDGRVWSLDQLGSGSLDAPGEIHSWDWAVPYDRLVAYVATGERIQVSYDGDLDRGTLGGASGGRLIGSVAGPLPRGDTYVLRFAGPDRAEGTLLFYRPV